MNSYYPANDYLKYITSFARAGETFSPEQVNTINTLRLICSGISILGCFFIVVVYILMCIKFRCKREDPSKNESISNYTSQAEENDLTMTLSDSLIDHNNVSFQRNRKRNPKQPKKTGTYKMGLGNDLIFFLILSNLFWCFGSFLGYIPFNSPEDKNDPLCVAQGFLQNYFDMSSICWNAIISQVTLLGTVTTYSTLRNMKKKMYMFFLYCNLFPLVLSLGPYLTDSYGSAGVWCWIDINDLTLSTVIWIISFYIFNWGNIIYIIYALVTTSKYFAMRKAEIGKDRLKMKEAKFLGKYILILRVFPLVLLSTRFASTFNRFYYLMTGEDSYLLYCVHSVAYSLSGFFNALLYSYFYRSIFNCCAKKELEVCDTVESMDVNSSEPSKNVRSDTCL